MLLNKGFVEIYLKTTLLSDFKIIPAAVWKTRILWSLKWGNTLQKQPLKAVLQVFLWQLLLKSFENVREGVKFSKKVEMNDFSGTFHGFSSPLFREVMLRNSFSLKRLSMTTGNFWTHCGQSLAGLCLFTEVRYRISKKV